MEVGWSTLADTLLVFVYNDLLSGAGLDIWLHSSQAVHPYFLYSRYWTGHWISNQVYIRGIIVGKKSQSNMTYYQTYFTSLSL